MSANDRQEMTVSQFIEMREGKWPSEASLRGIILDASWGKNNFQKAFKRVGRRVLIVPDEFWRCVDQLQEEQKHACK